MVRAPTMCSLPGNFDIQYFISRNCSVSFVWLLELRGEAPAVNVGIWKIIPLIKPIYLCVG